MENRLFQKASTLSALGLMLAILLFSVPSIFAQGNTGAEGPVGTWASEATFNAGLPPGVTVRAVETFHSDGTFSVVAQLPGVTIGSGVWKRSGPHQFTFSFSFFRSDPNFPGFPLLLETKVMENMAMIDGDNYKATVVFLPLAPDGTPMCDPSGLSGNPCLTATLKAKRYEFANFNTVQP